MAVVGIVVSCRAGRAAARAVGYTWGTVSSAGRLPRVNAAVLFSLRRRRPPSSFGLTTRRIRRIFLATAFHLSFHLVRHAEPTARTKSSNFSRRARGVGSLSAFHDADGNGEEGEECVRGSTTTSPMALLDGPPRLAALAFAVPDG